MNQENIQFFLENKEKINELVQFKTEFKKHIISETEKAGHSIAGVKLTTIRKSNFNKNRLRYFHSTKHSELVYTIVFEDLLKGSNIIHVIIEPKGNTLRKGKQFETIEFTSEEKKIIKTDFYTNLDKSWSHFAHKSYPVNDSDIVNLSDFIQEKIISKHFKSVFEKLEKFLTDRKKG